MSGDPPMTIRRDGPVTELVLNRPDKANALSAELVEMLIDAVSAASQDGTRLLVLRGEGKAFCGGFDFGDLDGQSDGDLALRLIRVEILLQEIHHAPMATMAFCHGGAFGAGADIVCACDSAVAATGTKFRMPGLRFGIALGTRRLAERIGTQRALDILTGSRVFEADEAKAIGLVREIADPGDWSTLIAQARDHERLNLAAKALLKSCAKRDMRAEDLAALARSASMPGLKARVAAFRSEGAKEGARR